MCSVPDGYGSISSWYQWFGGSSPGAGFGRMEGLLVLPDALPLSLLFAVRCTCPSALLK